MCVYMAVFQILFGTFVFTLVGGEGAAQVNRRISVGCLRGYCIIGNSLLAVAQ